MNKLFISILLVFTTVINLDAEKFEFEKKLLKFRYSLNEDLQKSSYEELQDFRFPDSVTEKISAFLAENSAEIKKYKLEILNEKKVRKLTKPGINYMLQKNDSTEFFENLESQMKEIQTPVFRFITINPFVMTNYFSTMYISRISTMELARQSYKLQITSPLFTCEKINSSTWQLEYDNYDYIFIFEYNIDSDSYKVLEIYHIKK